jgi:ribosomal protein S17E
MNLGEMLDDMVKRGAAEILEQFGRFYQTNFEERKIGLNYYSRKSSSHAKILVGFPTAYSLQPTVSVRAEPAL